MIYPNDIGKIWWDVIISAILCISCFCTPLDLALPKLFENLYWFNLSIDIFFLVDILVNFFSAIQD